METKSVLKKVYRSYASVTKSLIVIWASPEFQWKLKVSTNKKKDHMELMRQARKGLVRKNTRQNCNQIYKMCFTLNNPFLL